MGESGFDPEVVIEEAKTILPAVEVGSMDVGAGSSSTENYLENIKDQIFDDDLVLHKKIINNIISAELARANEYEQCAREMGTSANELKRSLQARIEMIVANSQLFMAISPKALEDVLNGSGRFKNQFETNETGGWATPRYRALLELEMFGFNSNLVDDKAIDYTQLPDEVITMNASSRPTYGYFSDHMNGIVNSEGKSPPESDFSKYGRVTIQFKEGVKKRTTVTFGDTIDCFEKGTAPSPALAPHFTSFPFPRYIPDAPTYINQLVASSKSIWGATPEAQFHGSLTADDIEAIHVSPANGLTTAEIEQVQKTLNDFQVANPDSVIQIIRY